MAASKHSESRQFGDFQTPPSLAADVCDVLVRRGIGAPLILEPTCGRGAFVKAAITAFPNAERILGVEINADYLNELKLDLGRQAATKVEVEQGDFFQTDWEAVLSSNEGHWLLLGNPPWVTNSELGSLNSNNLPTKTNFQGHRGFDAITGKANFDISEWMLLEQMAWLKKRSGWIAMLVKTSVARKVLKQAWKRHEPVGRAAMFKIDAKHHFGAAVDACLFVLPVNVGAISQDCDVYSTLHSDIPVSTIGFHDGVLVSNVLSYMKQRELIASNTEYIWRSGVKHDCSKVMELVASTDGQCVNGQGDTVSIENNYVFPMLKSSDVAKGKITSNRLMIVTQRKVGESTIAIETNSPETWRYLSMHSDALDKRGSVIYKDKPRFSVFGVGPYTYAPWKVAVSGFYKNVRFVKVGPVDDKPTVFDDTIYFLPCFSEEEADFVMSLVQSKPYQELMNSMIFPDEKRPVTAELLKRISLGQVAARLKLSSEYTKFTKVIYQTERERELAL